jgi:chromosome segregation ATPase
MNVDVSKLRAACERLHLLQVKLQRAQECVHTELDLQQRVRATLTELGQAIHQFSDHKKETSMLQRVLFEEASALAVLEKSLASQVRFGESNIVVLEGIHRRIGEEATSRSRIAADIRRLEETIGRARGELRELRAKTSDQEKHERGAYEHLVSRETALQRVREEIQFCQRARSCEQDNLNRMKNWAAKSHLEELRLLGVAQRRNFEVAIEEQPATAVGETHPEAPLASLKKEAVALLEEVVVSARLLGDKYHAR